VKAKFLHEIEVRGVGFTHNFTGKNMINEHGIYFVYGVAFNRIISFEAIELSITV